MNMYLYWLTLALLPWTLLAADDDAWPNINLRNRYSFDNALKRDPAIGRAPKTAAPQVQRNRKDKKPLDSTIHASNKPSLPLIPPLSQEDKGKKTVVLDMDETLIHAVHEKPDLALFPDAFKISFQYKGKPYTHYVLKRPGVDEFLRKVSQSFEVVLWTAGVKEYADAVLDTLDPHHQYIKYRLYRNALTELSPDRHNAYYTKELKLLGRNMDDVVIIDNSPHAYAMNPDNALPIPTWEGKGPLANRDAHLMNKLIILSRARHQPHFAKAVRSLVR